MHIKDFHKNEESLYHEIYGEVLDLIDRTAGYNSNTAYLYQGKSGEEHRKKLQQKIRNSCPAASRNANK